MKKQSELVAALLKELSAKEKELADQKWLFEQFLKSPSWRWTAPIRWAVNRFRSLKNGHHFSRPPELPDKTDIVEGVEPPAIAVIDEVKGYFTDLCRISLETFLASGSALELPRSDNPTVSIVLVLYNRAELTLSCLRSVAETRECNAEVVIVDNGSRDKTFQILERVRGARIITNSENCHFLAGANQGARECRGEYILFLNNDAQLLPGALQNALQTIRLSTDIGAVGGKIILLDGTLQEAGSIIWRDGSCTGYGRGDDPFAPMYGFRRDVDYCSGAFLLTPRRIWNELGGFDSIFEPAYYEETDYCMRLWERGLRVVYEPSASIIHYEFGSSKSTASATALQARNQRIFSQRHHTILDKHETSGTDALIRARSRNAERRILFIDDRVPHRWLGSGFPRANALHQALQRLGYFVTLYPLDVIHEPWEEAYSDFPREVEIMMGMGRNLLEPFLRIRRGYYSTVIVSRPHNMQWMAGLRKAHPDWFENVDVIYDAEALFSEREVGLRKLQGNPMSAEEFHAAQESEIRLTAAADRVISVSERECETFRSYGIQQVEVLGHSINLTPGEASFDSREGLLFVGAVHTDVSPNADSLIWFLREIFPRIQQALGEIPLTIAGVNNSELIRELASPTVRITGHQRSLDEFYSKARVFVAPTRYAAGIPHKLHEAAAYGLPIVATSLLAKQLGWTSLELAIADDVGTFAAECIQLYTDQHRWTKLRAEALGRVRRECSPQIFEDGVRRILGRQAEAIRVNQSDTKRGLPSS